MDYRIDNKILNAVFIGTFLLLHLSPLISQQEDYRMEQIPLKGELLNFSGTCLLQDSNGFMWFGSTDGLYRYDGTDFKRFHNDPFDKGSLLGHHIIGIVEDSAKNLWIASRTGLSRYDKYSGEFEQHKVGKGTILSVVADNEGSIWIGATNNGVFKLTVKTGRIKNYTIPEFSDEVKPVEIKMLFMDSFGSLWIQFGDTGLCRFNCKSESFEQYINAPCLLRKFYEDQAGKLWITSHCGLYQINRQTGSFEIQLNEAGKPDQLGKQMVRTLTEDRSGNLWIRTFDGIYKYNTDLELVFSWKYPEIYTMAQPYWDISLTLFEDQCGTIWFLCREGIQKLVKREVNFSVYENPIPPINKSMTELLLINDTFLLNGSQSEKFCAYDLKHRLVKTYDFNGARKFFLDSHEVLWIGTSHGLYRMLEPEGQGPLFERYIAVPGDSSSLPNMSIVDFFEDSDGKFWVACLTAMPCYYDRENDCFIQVTNNPNSQARLPVNVSICHETESKELWAINKGVYKIVPPFIRISEHSVMPSDVIEYVSPMPIGTIEDTYRFKVSLVDSKGVLWMGDRRMGLFKLEKDGPEGKKSQPYLTSYSISDGLSSNRIRGIQEDRKGNLWIATKNGLSKFDPESETFSNFNKQNGLPGNDFHWGSAKSSKGELFFCSAYSAISFFPDSIRTNTHIPPVKLTGFKVHNQEINPGENSILKKAIEFTDEVQLTHWQNNLTFSFAALNYIQPEQNQYKYMLEGVDRDWVYSGQRNIVTYAGLKYGNYIFRATGSNNDGIWNDKGITLAIHIQPPPWLTWWAYICYILLLAGTGIFIWRYLLNRSKMRTAVEVERMEKENVRELDQVKSRFFSNISHEFRTPLTLIAGPVNDLLKSESRTKDQERKLLSLVKRNARRLHQLINQLLEISKLETGGTKLEISEGDLSGFLRSIASSYLSLAEKNEIQYRIDVKKSSEPVFFDRDKVEKIACNLLSNALKYTPEGGSVQASLIYLPNPSKGPVNRAKIIVTDTGPGIPAEEQDKVFDRFYQVVGHEGMYTEGSGIGLALTKELVVLYRGDIKLESEIGKGSTFSVTLPVSRDSFREDEFADLASVSEPDSYFDTKLSAIEEPENMVGKDNPLILIVEDNADLRAYISQSLALDFQILEACNGAEGLEKAREIIPELVITDLMMPVMDGMELCRSLKQDERTSHIPLIILTARADLATKLESLETGADDYLVKPFDSGELNARVKNLIQQRKQLRKKFGIEFFLKDPYQELSNTDERFLERVSEIIKDHLTDADFSVESFSRLAGMSSSQLYRKLNAIANLSPSQFIRNLRLKHSLLLLKKGNDNIARIAYEVGFNDHAYFSKCFRELYGISPSEYAEGKQGNKAATIQGT